MPSARPLQRWLALRIVLAGLVPLAVVAALVWGVLLPQLRADLEIRYQTLARAIAGQIETHLLGAGRELYAVTEYLRSRGQRPAPFWFSPLDAHAGAGDVFAAIYIVEADSSVYAVGLPPAARGQRDNLLGLDLSQWAVLREARERNEAVWSETFLSAVTGRLAVTLAIPVVNQMLIGEIAIDRLSEFIGRSPAESGMVTMILDRRGQIIAHSRAALSGQQISLGHLPIVGDALQGRFATRSFEWDGETFVGAPVSVPQLGWIVLVAQPRSEAFRPFLSTLWVLAAGALVALLLAILIALVLAHGFAQRIGHYAEQAHAIAEGDYDQPWPVSRIQEFDRLADDLDRMSLAIRQRERDLATSEARYRSVISNAPVVIFQFDERGVFSLSEGKSLVRFGLAPGEAVGQSVFELYRDYPEICEYARRAIGGETFQCVSRTGDIFFDVSYNSVRDRDGYIQVTGVAMDTTERQRAEESLRESEDTFRKLFEGSSDPILLLEGSRFVECNQAALKLLGAADKSRFIGSTPLDISPERQPDGRLSAVVAPEYIARAHREGNCRFEWLCQRYDGTPLLIDVSLIPIALKGESLLHNTWRDITERKQAEQKLLESERKYRELVENANSIILRWNPEGEITFINEFGLKFFGYSEAELVGQHVVGTIVPPNESTGKDLRPLMEEICLHPERFERNVNENLRRGGERIWVSWTNKAVLDDRGQVMEVFSVGSDITERKRAEAELQRHREHLEELVAERTAELRQVMAQLVQSEKLAALGSLVAGVAHELNTPLGNARVVASSLGEHLQDFAAAVESGSLRRSQVDAFLNRGREAVDLLERNAARAADLISHFKQVAVDQTSTRRRRFNLGQTVEEVLVTLRPQFKRTAHRIELEIPPDLELDSYPGPLEQVIANLISNSLTHGFEGVVAGVIRICAAPLEATHVHIDYTDNGVGIPETIANRIFDPFFTTKLGSGGSGLGLYIVYNLVTGALGGAIQVHSPGCGVAFTLTLPRTAPTRSVLEYSHDR